MTTKKTFYVMLGSLASLALLLGTMLYFGNKSLVEESHKLVDLKATNQTLESQQTNLLGAQQDIEKYSNIEEITNSIVPQDKDQARAVREVIALAKQSGFEIRSITFPTSNLGIGNRSSGDTAESATPAPISQAVPVKGISGVYSLEATIVPTGPVQYSQFLGFLKKLENNRRTSQVSSIRIEPQENSPGTISFTLKINLFLKP